MIEQSYMIKKIKNITVSALFIVFVIVPSQWLWAKIVIHTLIENQVYYGEIPKNEDEVKSLSENYITYIVHLQETGTSSISTILKKNKIKDEEFKLYIDSKELHSDPNLLVPVVKIIGDLRSRGEVVYLIEPNRSFVNSHTKIEYLKRVLSFRHKRCYRIDNKANAIEGKIKGEMKKEFRLEDKDYNTLLEKKDKLCGPAQDFLAEEGYVLKQNADSFFAVSEKYKVAIGIRNAGHYTLKWIANGNPRKGHGILQKSIKPKSLEELRKSETPGNKHTMEYLFSKGLFGLVAKWNNKNGIPFPEKLFTAKIKTGKDKEQEVLKHFYEEHNPKEKQELFDTIDLKYDEPETNLENLNLAYTGDYDLQELIRIIDTGEKKDTKSVFKIYRLPNHKDVESIKIFENYEDAKSDDVWSPEQPAFDQELPTDAYILRQLNKNLIRWGVIEPVRKFGNQIGPKCPIQHWSLIQHGAQQNYMWSYEVLEQHEELVKSLLNPDPEIALILPNDAKKIHPSMGKGMLIFRNADELYLFYKMVDLLPWWETKRNLELYKDKDNVRKKLEKTKNNFSSDPVIVNIAHDDLQIKSVKSTKDKNQELAVPYKGN